MSETKQVGSGVVIRNTMTTSVTDVVNLIASLFLVPYILSKLSIDLYGAFALILVIVRTTAICSAAEAHS
jgi:O-antigen/teichoic acid export membrane protein